MFRIPYGKSGINMPKALASNLCETNLLELPESTIQFINEDDITQSRIIDSLKSPYLRPNVSTWVKSDDKVVIIIPDITRKCPIIQILEVLIPKIEVPNPSEIIILVANGNHRFMTEDELKKHVSKDVYNNYNVLNHDSKGDVTYIGTTTSGNKIKVNSLVVNADKVFCIGSANYHTFAGFSGGRKSILPGIAARESILYNHRLMMDSEGISPHAVAGSMQNNKLQLDMCEAQDIFGREKLFIINTVTNIHNQVLKAYSGCPVEAFKNACVHVVKQYSIYLKDKFDIVIASASGDPSDKSFYQSQKAYDIALPTTKQGGHFFLLSECCDGVGEDVALYKKWLTMNNKELVQSLKSFYHNLAVGPYRINQLKEIGVNLHIVSENLDKIEAFLSMDIVKPIDFDTSIEKVIAEYNKKGIIPKVGIIPFASHSVFQHI